MKQKPLPLFIWLASRSPRRRLALKEMGIEYRCTVSTYREGPLPGKTPSRTVIEHACGKAAQARLPSRRHKNRCEWVLGADTLIYFRGRVIGKPASYDEAVRTLQAMAGRVHHVYTGIALRNVHSGKIITGWEKTRIQIKKWDTARLRDYVRRIGALDKAGGYGIQCRPGIVSRCDGSRSNVTGLPRRLLRRLMSRAKKL